MAPKEVVEVLAIGCVSISFIILSFLLKGNWRIISRYLAVMTLMMYCVFYVVHPFWIDTQIDKKVDLLRPYLLEHYPDGKWVITTVPHREDDYKSQNPYTISVTFESEPEATYYYRVKAKDKIYQSGYSKESGSEDFKHLERWDE